MEACPLRGAIREKDLIPCVHTSLVHLLQQTQRGNRGRTVVVSLCFLPETRMICAVPELGPGQGRESIEAAPGKLTALGGAGGQVVGLAGEQTPSVPGC